MESQEEVLERLRRSYANLQKDRPYLEAAIGEARYLRVINLIEKALKAAEEGNMTQMSSFAASAIMLLQEYLAGMGGADFDDLLDPPNFDSV